MVSRICWQREEKTGLVSGTGQLFSEKQQKRHLWEAPVPVGEARQAHAFPKVVEGRDVHFAAPLDAVDFNALEEPGDTVGAAPPHGDVHFAKELLQH